MSENRLDQLADGIRRLIAALEDAVRERDALRQRLQELNDGVDSPGAGAAPPPPDPPSPAPAPAGDANAADDDGLMEHVVMLESERAEIRDRLSRLLRRLEEVDLGE